VNNVQEEKKEEEDKEEEAEIKESTWKQVA